MRLGPANHWRLNCQKFPKLQTFLLFGQIGGGAYEIVQNVPAPLPGYKYFNNRVGELLKLLESSYNFAFMKDHDPRKPGRKMWGI